jgi:hypothetical protein
MSKASTGEAVLDAIIDQELEAAELIEATINRLDVTKKRLRSLARRIYKLRTEGKMGKREARNAFVEGFVFLALAEYAHDVPKLKAMTDKHLVRQYEAIRGMGDRRLGTLRQVRDIDIKARKAGGDGQEDA